MVVIAHDGIGAEFDTEERGQHTHPVFDPTAAVLVAFAGVLIDAAEKGPSYAARGDVVVRRVFETHQMFTGSWHVKNDTQTDVEGKDD